MTLGLLVALENVNKVLSDIQRIFNTGPYGDPPLKIKICKIGLRSDLSWPKVGSEPKFHEPGTFGGFGKREQADTQDLCFTSIDYVEIKSDIGLYKSVCAWEYVMVISHQ